MRIDLVTALPDLVRSPLDHSIVQRAQDKELLDIRVHDLRQYGEGKHRQIDDYPFGGRGGMVLMPGPLFTCIEEIQEDWGEPGEVIFLTPDGETMTQSIVNELSMLPRMCLIAGHYKGIDQRIRDIYVTCELSIGDYVLSGGELPAAVLVDAVARLLPGVLSDETSALSDSFQGGLLDAPIYTRPADWRGHKVPDVLLSGNEAAINRWRDEQALARTQARRPDLLEG